MSSPPVKPNREVVEVRAASAVRRSLRWSSALDARTGLPLALATLLGSSPLLAAPTGGAVTTGAATISQSGQTTNVNQTSDKASITWQGFSVAPAETVNFHQPSASSITLNRVVGNERSVIEGALNANGQVFLVNSNGVLFTQGSQVNVGGLVASTLDVSDADFQAGNYAFKGSGGNNQVRNAGLLHTTDGGYVALLGTQVSNEGTISASRGTVALASGEQVTLNFNGNSLLSVTVDQGTLNALVENKQAIFADGGKVILTAKAVGDVLSAQVNASGIIQARTLGDLKGAVTLHTEGGTTTVRGTLDASAPTSGDGGRIETSGDQLRVADGAIVTTNSASGATGDWVASADGLSIGSAEGSLSAAQLANALGSNNVTIAATKTATTGDLIVDDKVAWTSDNKLTLTAAHEINVNKAITGSGQNARLSLNYGGDYRILTPATYSGAELDADGLPVARRAPDGTEYASITLSGQNATLQLNGTAYALVHNLDQLAAATNGNFALAQDLDAADWSRANGTAASVLPTFTGTLAGLGHTVGNLTLTAPPLADYVGLIGSATSANLRDLGVVNVAFSSGRYDIGALLGSGTNVTIDHAYSTGSIVATSGANVGGLVGLLESSGQAFIRNSHSDVDVLGVTNLGGLLGTGQGRQGGGSVVVDGCHATGDIQGHGGGLIGYLRSMVPGSAVTNSYATGNVAGGNGLGGLIASVEAGDGSKTDPGYHLRIRNVFATGNVSITNTEFGAVGGGGLIGSARWVDLDNGHASGNVKVTNDTVNPSEPPLLYDIGGLTGLQFGGTITNSTAKGDVTFTGGAASAIGGLVGGTTKGAISNSSYAGHVNGDGARQVGGLAGLASGATITNVSVSGSVSGRQEVGGLVGNASNAQIDGAHTSANVTGSEDGVGGLVGWNNSPSLVLPVGNIRNSTASGNVSGRDSVGGLVGISYGDGVSAAGTISNSYASGSVNGRNNVGGLVGYNNAAIENSGASGAVTGSMQVGGLVGTNDPSSYRNGPPANAGSILNSYFDTQGTGRTNAVGSDTGKSYAQGLTHDEYAAVGHYVDGSINQILSQQAIARENEANQLSGQYQQATAQKLADAQAAIDKANQAKEQATQDADAQVAHANATTQASTAAIAKSTDDAAKGVAAANATVTAAQQEAEQATARAASDAAVQIATAQALQQASRERAAQAAANALAQVASIQASAQQQIQGLLQDAAQTAAATQADIDAGKTRSTAAKDGAAASAAKIGAQAADQANAIRATADAQAAAIGAKGNTPGVPASGAPPSGAPASGTPAPSAPAATAPASAAMTAARATGAATQGMAQQGQVLQDNVGSARRGTQSTRFPQPVTLQDNIVFDEPDRFSAGIERIEVDGQVYELAAPKGQRPRAPSRKPKRAKEQLPPKP